jgi:hypothetical protein
MQTLEDWAASVSPEMANEVARWFEARLAQLDDLDDRDALIAEWFNSPQ